MIKWLAANNLVLNLDKYNEIHNKEFITFDITYWFARKVCRRDRVYRLITTSLGRTILIRYLS
jgi:hypothetical protein